MRSITAIMGVLVMPWLVSGAVAAPIIWTGPATTCTQPGSNPTLIANQDRLTDTVWITRASSQGLFNAALESSFGHNSSPAGTEWAYGSADNWQSLTFTNWEDWFGGAGGGGPGSTINRPAVLHLVSDDIYLDIMFLSIGRGGGFSYTRSTASTVPEPSSLVVLGAAAMGLMGRVRRRR